MPADNTHPQTRNIQTGSKIKGVGRAHMSNRDSSSEVGPGDLETLDKLVIRLVLAANAVMDRHSNPV